MNERVKFVSVHVSSDSDVRHIPFHVSTTIEDVLVTVCRQLGIGPVARHLFAFRLYNTRIWMISSCRIADTSIENVYELRLRFKVPCLQRLMKVDIKAYDYYFHQARSDVLNNKISDISYDKNKWELLGLGVTDMYRVMLEKGVERDIVENDYKKYIPKEVVKHHLFFIKKPIHESLSKLKKNAKHDAWYVKGEYLQQFEDMAPNYLSEEYIALTDEAGCVRTISLNINPFDVNQPGVRFRYDGKQDWHQLCTIDDLCYISVRNDGTVEISRKNGIPYCYKFQSIPFMLSFVSLLDGYYRLMVKWTFNLCKDIATPSLVRLYALKCHGPVGGEFSYSKLEEKRNNEPGCFILRESELKYDTFYLDVCTKSSSKPKTFKIEKIDDDEYLLCEENKSFTSLSQLVAAYRSGESEILLQECVPPSEYDKSPLLICQPEYNIITDFEGGAMVAGLMTGTPQCIDVTKLQVYKNQGKEGKGNLSILYRSVWIVSKGKKIECAMKILKQECRDQKLKEFLALAGKWAFLQSNAVVKLFGVTLSSPFAMVMEYLSLGSLDEYLSQHRYKVKTVDLVEAGTYLATALWHLEEHGIIHGNIRCRKILVSAHDDSSFSVRLADPGLHTYSDHDVHWMPVEFMNNFDFARASVSADVWAFGTTMWEIFSYGDSPPTRPEISMKRFYMSGRKLPIPHGCPVDVYKLICECWDRDPYKRKKPQAIMRDINQIWYQVYNSRRTHSYAQAFSVADSNTSIFSGATEDTFINNSQSDLLSLCGPNDVEPPVGQLLPDFSGTNSLEEVCRLEHSHNGWDDDSSAFTGFGLYPDLKFTNTATTIDSVTSMQSIFELDADCNVVLQGRIGQGFYGEVYKGTLEQEKDLEPQLVAIKKLKKNALGTSVQDFEREISIMKTLKHPNIVEIKGVFQEPEVSLIMEYVPHGSLQSYLKINKDLLDEKTLLKFSLDVAKGMEYLGWKNVVHRDLAARNILVASENHVKISDFGLAQVTGQNDYYFITTNRELPIKWYAPESLRDGKFSSRSDVWSYGVTLYEMFSRGEEPKLLSCINEEQNQQKLLAALESGNRLPCPPECRQEVYVTLMTPCWQADAHTRPTFTQLCCYIQDMQADV